MHARRKVLGRSGFALTDWLKWSSAVVKVVNTICNQKNNANMLIIALLRTSMKMERSEINTKKLEVRYDFLHLSY